MCDPVGTHEIAQRLGVTRKAVHKWRERGLGFPDARWLVGNRPAWDFGRDVVPWCLATGRLEMQAGKLARPAAPVKEPA